MGVITAKIIEQGNGLPSEGDYCSGDGQLYEIVSTYGAIHTDDSRGNYVWGKVVEADWSDCAEGDEHSALVVVDTDVV